MLDPRSEAFKLARKLADGALVRSNTNVGELMIAYKEAGGDVSFMTKPAADMSFIPAQEYETATEKMQAQDDQFSTNPEGSALPQTDANEDEGSGAQAQPDAGAQARRAATDRNMIKAVAALSNLPSGVQAQADAYAARQALYDYMKADESGKAAAYSKAVEQLSKSISEALESQGLDAGTRQALEEVLTAMDEEGKSGYNRLKRNINDNEQNLEIIQVELSKKSYPEATAHIQDAIQNGQPEVLTINREKAKSNRKASLKGIKKIPGLDLDEYPPAMFEEGGKGASVRAIGQSDNRGAGSTIGYLLRPYPNGTKVRIIIRD